MSYQPHTQATRFWTRVERCAHGAECDKCCWPWRGATDDAGYGRTRYVLLGVDETYVHRVAFALHYKRLAGKKEVCHSCDNPPCCNPAHLWEGTHKENHRDSMQKGRRAHNRTPRKLTPAHVRKARAMWKAGNTQRVIAAAIGVSQPLISQIVTGRIWK